MPPRKPKRGRPEKLTPEVQKVILDSIAGGVPQKYAAQRAGVGERSVRDWVSRGKREKSGAFFAFAAALKKAQADRLAASVARIGRAAQGGQVIERTTVTTVRKDGTTVTKTVERAAPAQWTADAWFLERRYPDLFGRREATPVKGKGGANAEGHASAEVVELLARLAALAGAGGRPVARRGGSGAAGPVPVGGEPGAAG